MYLNLTGLFSNFKESVDIISTLIGGIIGASFGIAAWLYEKKMIKRATLYLPLLLACRDIIDVLKNCDHLEDSHCRDLYSNCAKILDEIVYTHGSIIYLTKGDDLNAFLSMKKIIDDNLEYVKTTHRTNLPERFISKEFIEVKGYAEDLLSRCKKEVKQFKKIRG